MSTPMIDSLAVGAVSGPPAGTLSGALVFHSITISAAPGGSLLVFNLVLHSEPRHRRRVTWCHSASFLTFGFS